jgi:ATP-dependent Lon protease
MVPISNEWQFAAHPEETVENLDVIFYGDLDRAVPKAIEL